MYAAVSGNIGDGDDIGIGGENITFSTDVLILLAMLETVIIIVMAVLHCKAKSTLGRKTWR